MNQRERNTHQKSSLFSRANMVAVLGLIVFSHLGHVPASYGQLTVPVAEPIDPVTVGSKPVRVSISTRDLDAEWLALKTSGELLAPTKMYNRMLADLTAIRTAFPVVANIHAKPDWVLGEVVLSGIFPPPLTPTQKKCLSTRYLGTYSITTGYAVTTITYTKHYNSELLVMLLNTYCGIDSEPNYYYGDGDGGDITYDLLSGLYTFRQGWEDCMAGCIENHFWVFSINAAGQVTLVSESGDPLP